MDEAVFDTTVFIDAYNEHPGALALLEAARTRALAASFAAASAYELWLRDMNRLEEASYLSSFAILQEVSMTAAIAREVGRLLRGSPRAQRLRFAADAMIAATAASLGATIYTRNPRDLARFYPDVHSY